MKVSRAKIFVFFIALILLAWILYPRELFLGYIYEGRSDLSASAAYYKSYLQTSPHSKFATVRLAELYERMGRPEESLPLLRGLMDHRPRDWELAELYMQMLADLSHDRELYEARLEVFERFADLPRFPKARLENLLYDAYLYTLWNQDYEEAYRLVMMMAKIAKNPDDYYEELAHLDLGLQKMDRVLLRLQTKLQENPQDFATRAELTNIYLMIGRDDDALHVIAAGLKLAPDHLLLLQKLFVLHTKLNDDDAMIADLKSIVVHDELNLEDRFPYLQQLAHLYFKRGLLTESFALYESILEQDPDSRENWLNFISALAGAKRIDSTIDLLKKYLQRFPNDYEQEKYLVDLYLYEKMDLGQTEYYEKFIKKYSYLPLAVDVGYSFLQKNQDAKAYAWLTRMMTLFPGEFKILVPLVEAQLRLHREGEALHLVLGYLDLHPGHVEALLKVGDIHALLFENFKALSAYQKAVSIRPNDAHLLKLVGQQIFFVGYPQEALEYLQQSLVLKPEDPETWFWLSEIHMSRQQKVLARKAARRVVDCFAGKNDLSIHELRIKLKSRGRLRLDDALLKDYALARARYKNDLQLHFDLLDLYFEEGQFVAVAGELKQLQREVKTGHPQIRSYEIRLALAEKKWDRAITLIRQLLHEDPRQRSLELDLAEAYQQKGDWQLSLATYEHIRDVTGDDRKISRVIDDLHQRYDPQVRSGFNFVDFGDDTITEFVTGFKSYLSQHLLLGGESRVGQYKSSLDGMTGNAERGHLRFTYESFNWDVHGGLGYGHSYVRSGVSPFAGVGYHFADVLQLETSYIARKLRLDLPQAVSQGVFYDIAELKWEFFPHDRLLFVGSYEFHKNYLPGGQKSFEHILDPAVSFVLFKKPFISVGYQFSFTEASDENGFLNRVPLVGKARSHYLTLAANERFFDNLYVEAGFFMGEDTARNLHFFAADLWGLRAHLKWHILPWLDFDSTYSYGRESLTSIAGDNHQMNAGLSVHWQ